MKQPMRLAVGVAAFAVSLAGCQSLPDARVVRLVQNTNSAGWQLSVNGAFGTTAFSDLELTKEIARLGLHQGDLILLGSLPYGQTNSATNTWDWIRRYSDSNSVAVYMYAVHAAVPGADMFSVPVYHWSAPFDHPRSLPAAAFFREGKFLGTGMNGFRSLMRSIASTRPKRAFILGSLYDINKGYGPYERPYEGQQGLLDQVLKQTGTEVVLLDPEEGF